jgi:RNA polymerase-interacting CarD/CdnL/TRCF family regulator
MVSAQNAYKKKDWVVHKHYGLGQVIGEDEKILDGEKQRYLKVKTSDILYWIPVEKVDFDRVRPVASINQIKYAFTLVQKTPKKLAKDYIARRKEISLTLNNVSLYSNVRLIRDLKGRAANSKSNMNDDTVLEKITIQFLNECTLVLNQEHRIVEKKLYIALKKSMEKV